ncbi:MAG: serine hydrolase domain-containing protein [Pseudomonadota bacterium]
MREPLFNLLTSRKTKPIDYVCSQIRGATMKLYWVYATVILTACVQQDQAATEVMPEVVSAPYLETVGKIPELMDAFDVSGLAVSAVRKNEIFLSTGFGVNANGDEYTATSSCGLYSATKVLASLTYAVLSDQGKIGLDSPLSQYIEDAPGEWQAIPFFRLLNHTSGIAMAVNKDAFAVLASDPKSTNTDVYQLVREAPLDYEPGQYSRYRQSGYAIAEMILSNSLGESFDALVDEYVIEPAGMTSTQHPAVGGDGPPAILLSAGGYQTTADDMARLFMSLNNGKVLAPEKWKSLLLGEQYLFENYSLGSVIEERGGVLTLGHSGGGARANIRYAPDEQIGVMVCTDDTENNGLAISLARMLVHEIASGESPLMPLQVALAGYKDMSGAQILAAYRAAEAQTDRYDFSNAEAILNRIGYAQLENDKVADALDVFAFNADTFPQSPNVHDSLGEALLVSGDIEGALMRYRQVLLLDPGNENATAMINEILIENDLDD